MYQLTDGKPSLKKLFLFFTASTYLMTIAVLMKHFLNWSPPIRNDDYSFRTKLLRKWEQAQIQYLWYWLIFCRTWWKSWSPLERPMLELITSVKSSSGHSTRGSTARTLLTLPKSSATSTLRSWGYAPSRVQTWPPAGTTCVVTTLSITVIW